MHGSLEEVRRETDSELEGYIRGAANGFEALTVFHGVLAAADTAAEARDIVHARGLSSLAERWYWWSRLAEAWSVVILQEVSPGTVRAAIGYYSLPDSETVLITSADIDEGDVLTLEPPDAPVRGLPG